MAVTATFTRNSAAYNQAGGLVRTGVPRFEPGRHGQAILVEEPVTNLLSAMVSQARSGLQSNNVAFSTITFVTDFGRSSNFSALLTQVQVAPNVGFYALTGNHAPITAGLVYTASCWIYTNHTGRSARAFAHYLDSGGSDILLNASGSVTPLTPGAWTRVTVTSTAPANAVWLRAVAWETTTSQIGDQFWYTDLQVEQRAYPTTWQLGGTPRAAESLTIPTAGVLSPTEGTVEFWWTPLNQPASTIISQFTSPPIVEVGNYFQNNSWLLWVWPEGLRLWVRGDGAAGWTGSWLVMPLANFYTLGQPVHFVIRWATANTFHVFVNGVSYGPYVSTRNFTGIAGNWMSLGRVQAASGGSNAFFDDLRISNRARTNQEIADAFNSGRPQLDDAHTTCLITFDTTLRFKRSDFVVRSNSPSPGFISWENVDLRYQNISYNLPNGNTSLRYVWWEFATPYNLFTSNTLPVLSNDDLILFFNRNGIAVTVPNATVVDGSLIVRESIVTDALAANSIDASKIAANAVGANAIAAGAVSAGKIAANAVVAGNIAAAAITSREIAANTILAENMTALSITGRELAANSVIAGKIAAGSISSNEIAANAITGVQIAAGSIDATKIAAGTITSEHINAGGITANTITSGTLNVERAHVISSDGMLQIDGTGITVLDEHGVPGTRLGRFGTESAELTPFTRASTAHQQSGALVASGQPRYETLPLPTPRWNDVFTQNLVSTHYLSGGDVAASWSVANQTLSGVSGTHATLLRSDLSLTDGEIIVHTNQAHDGGIIVRHTDNFNYYLLKLADNTSIANHANTGITWTARTSVADNSWISVCWSPERGLFVAVAWTGAGNRVMTSPDGLTWTIRTGIVDNEWRSVCWSAERGLFVAVAWTGAGNRVMTSPDGLTWTIRTGIVDNWWQSVCWSAERGLFVAVATSGTGNRVMTSPDGITWTTRTSAADIAWISVCWSPERGLFAAVATSGAGNRVMTSPDGIVWTIRTGVVDNVWQSVCWSPERGLFVAVASTGAGNRVMTSPDGITWTIRTGVLDNNWRSVCWSAERGLFVAVASGGVGNRVMTSPDGIVWTARTGIVDNAWQSVCWSPERGLFVAVAQTGTGNRVMTSGINTPVQNVQLMRRVGGIFRAIAWANVSWVRGDLARIRFRYAGSRLDVWFNDIRVISIIDTTFSFGGCGVYHHGNVATQFLRFTVHQAIPGVTFEEPVTNLLTANQSSVDTDLVGFSRTSAGTLLQRNLTGVRSGTGVLSVLCAGTNTSQGFSTIPTPTSVVPNQTHTGSVWLRGTGNFTLSLHENASTDAAVWTIRTTPIDSDWQSICWSAERGLFVAVSAAGTGMTSPDGITWTTRTSAADNFWTSVCWSPERGLFVAVAVSGVGNRVMTSPDGITWTARTGIVDNLWLSVCWSAERGLFVAVAQSGVGNRVMTSPDGITWTVRTTPIDNAWESVCWSAERGLFVAVATTGVGNRVMTSPDGITWTARTGIVDNAWRSICWSPERGLFVAVAVSGVGNRVMTSPDGITWTARTGIVDNNWLSVCWSAERGLFVAVASTGTGNRVMTSPDGLVWTARTGIVDNVWRGVCWSPERGLFVAVAQSGVGNRVMTSFASVPTSSAITLTPSWTRYSVVAPLSANALSVFLSVRTTTPQTTIFWADDLQIEQRAYATTWQMGGTPRVLENMTLPTQNVFNPGNWSIEGIYTSIQNNILRTLINYQIDASNMLNLTITNTNAWRLDISSNAVLRSIISADAAIIPNTTYLWQISGNGTIMRLCVNGQQIGLDTAYAEPIGALPTNIFVGAPHVGVASANGFISNIRVSNYAKTLADHQAVMNSGVPLTLINNVLWFSPLNNRLNRHVFNHGLQILTTGTQVLLIDGRGLMQTWQESDAGTVSSTVPLILNVFIPTETRNIQRGILRFRTAVTGLTVTINGVDRTAALGGPFSTHQNSLNILSFLNIGQWNTISLGSTVTGRVDGTVFIQVFLNT